AHAAAGAHALHVARDDGRAVAHRILVAERALEHVADDLHVTVAVRAEARARLHAILVDDAQRTEPHVLRVVVIREGEAVVRVEPAVVGVAALATAPELFHPAWRRFPGAPSPCRASWPARSPARGRCRAAHRPAGTGSPSRGTPSASGSSGCRT